MISTRKRLTWAVVAAAACLIALSCIAKRMPNVSDALRRNAKIQINLLSDRLQRYAEDRGRLPATLNELAEISGGNAPYVQAKDIVDPYDHAFVYVAPGVHGAFDLVFLGKDGKPGGTGYDADIGNWELPGARSDSH